MRRSRRAGAGSAYYRVEPPTDTWELHMATVFVGDVHGCAAELGSLLHAVGFTPGEDRLLLTGDAFARGPDPGGVWQLIKETDAQMVLGNHDDRLLSRLRRRRSGKSVEFRQEHHRQTFAALQPHADALLDWLEQRPLHICEPAFLLVHAGINPLRGMAATTRDEFLTIRLWPPASGIQGTRWHQLYEPEGRLIVFGHDAPGGLVQRRDDTGRLYLMGLDSGCVYGGELSAYHLERDRVFQVPCSQQGGHWQSR
jgi:hypothetical protein